MRKSRLPSLRHDLDSLRARDLKRWLGRAQVESLEARRLLASVNLAADGTLTVTGTAGDDFIGVGTSGNLDVTVFDGPSATPIGTFARNDVKHVIVRGLGGNDNLASNNDAAAGATYTLDGGDGNDLLRGFDIPLQAVGGAGNDTVLRFGGTLVSFAGGSGIDTVEDNTSFASGSIDLTLYPDVENARLRPTAAGLAITGNALNNVLTIVDSAFPATIRGGGGNDTITGGSGDDRLEGDAGNDSIVGGAGFDTLVGGTGGDTLEGGDGIDTADYSARSADLFVGLGSLSDDGESGEGDNVFIDIETIIGGSGNDRLRGSGADNRLVGNAGNDTLEGLGGVDTLLGGVGNDSLLGGAGNDSLNGDAGQDTLAGESGTDFLHGGDGLDIGVDDGVDTLVSIENIPVPPGDAPYVIEADGTLVIRGTSAADQLQVFGNQPSITIILNGDRWDILGSDAQSVLRVRVLAGDGADNISVNVNDALPRPVSILGEGGNDTISAGDAPEWLDGGAGNDSLIGGLDDDTLVGGAGGDTLEGGAGSDTADYSDRSAPLTIGLGSLSDDGEANEHDNLFIDIETILGGSGNDHIKGSGSANLLAGNGGTDTLLGLGGNDTLEGGAGTDSLDGGTGTDTGVNTAGDTLVSIENTTGGGGDENVVEGPDGNITVTGTAEADTIRVEYDDLFRLVIRVNGVGHTFDDDMQLRVVTVLAGDGDDSLLGGTRANVIFYGDDGADRFTLHENLNDLSITGGPGDDTFAISGFHHPSSRMDGGSGIDTLDAVDYFGGSTVDLNVTRNIENAIGGEVQTLIIGNASANRLIMANVPYSHVVTLRGNAGDDTLTGGFGSDRFEGGTGNDTLGYSGRTADLTIGPGSLPDDGEAGEKDNVATDIETILGGSGNDHIKGTGAANRLVGNGGDDTLLGLDGNDTLLGGGGADHLEGQAGNDSLLGGEQNDRLFGGSGNDALAGGAGDDLLDGQSGADSIDGGAGFDRAFDDDDDLIDGVEQLL